jgi:hypothetical protein
MTQAPRSPFSPAGGVAGKRRIGVDTRSTSEADAFMPFYRPGAIVQLWCEQCKQQEDAEYMRGVASTAAAAPGIWREGTVIRRERQFTAAEGATGQSRSPINADDGEALMVAQQTANGDLVYLLWQPPPGCARTNAAVPQGMWRTHVVLVEEAPTAGVPDQLRTPADLGGLAGGLAEHEHMTLHAMASWARARTETFEGRPSRARHATDARFAARFLDGHGGQGSRCAGNPGLDKLLQDMPHRAIVQDIFQAAGTRSKT